MISFLDFDSSAAISCTSRWLHFTALLPSSCGAALFINRLEPVRWSLGALGYLLFGVSSLCRFWKPTKLSIYPELSARAVRHLTGMVALVSNVQELNLVLKKFPPTRSRRNRGLAFLYKFTSLKELRLSLSDPYFGSGSDSDAKRTSISLDQLRPLRHSLISLTIRTSRDYQLKPEEHLADLTRLSVLVVELDISCALLFQLAVMLPLLRRLGCQRIYDGSVLDQGAHDWSLLQLQALTSLRCTNMGLLMFSIILPNQRNLRRLVIDMPSDEHEFAYPLTALEELRLVDCSNDALALYLRPIKAVRI
jgi:hypothetical protein